MHVCERARACLRMYVCLCVCVCVCVCVYVCMILVCIHTYEGREFSEDI